MCAPLKAMKETYRNRRKIIQQIDHLCQDIQYIRVSRE